MKQQTKPCINCGKRLKINYTLQECWECYVQRHGSVEQAVKQTTKD